MNATEITKKHLQERIDLETMQQSEVAALLKRHRLSSVEAPGKYFERKRQQEMSKLIDEHKKELSGLFDSQEKEWEQWRSVKMIIRESQQLSFDLQPQVEKSQQPKQEKVEEKGFVKKMLSKVKIKTRNKQQEM